MTYEPRGAEQTDRCWRLFPSNSVPSGDRETPGEELRPTVVNGAHPGKRSSQTTVVGSRTHASRTACVFGLGADIGSNLISQNDPERDGFAITTAVTKPIPGADAERSMESLAARLTLADSTLLGRVKINADIPAVSVDGRVIAVHFRDVVTEPLDDIGPFDFGFVATHRSHVQDEAIMEKIHQSCDVVLGAAENPRLPGLYGPLLDAPLHHIDAAITAAVPSDGLPEIFALGSCQCVGWAAQLRGLLEALEVSGQQALGLRRMEVDIVHPDTASGRLGTHMIGAREEDPRDNLRPGVSQLQTSMRRFPGVQSVNTVSLRVLTQPPGYQICRFFTEAKLSVRDVREGLERARCVLPEMVETTTTPIDSRAFARTQHVATVITAPSHLTVGQIVGTDLSIVIMQSYVHNTIGYCRSILSTAGRLLTAAPVAALAAIDTPVGAATGA
jgi:hypothetical protein